MQVSEHCKRAVCLQEAAAGRQAGAFFWGTFVNAVAAAAVVGGKVVEIHPSIHPSLEGGSLRLGRLPRASYSKQVTGHSPGSCGQSAGGSGRVGSEQGSRAE